LFILRLKLVHQLIILVSVPLVFGLAFTGVLGWLLRQAELDALAQERARQMIVQVKLLGQAVDDALMTLGRYSISRGNAQIFSRFKNQEDEVLKSLHELEPLATTPGEKDCYRKIQMCIADQLRSLTMIEGLIDAKGSNGLRTVMAYGDLENLRNKLQSYLDRMTLDARNIQATANNGARNHVVMALVGGSLLNIMLTVGLAIYLSKSLGKRLEQLTDNSMRLAAGVPLNPVGKGQDEIAKLDSVFHRMADVLADAAAQERAANERVRSMIQNLPVGIISISQEGTIDSVNPRIEEIFGYQADKLVGRPFTELFGAHCSDTNLLEKLKTQALNQSIEMDATRSEGSPIPIELSLTPYESPDGKRYLLNVQDISERRQIEKMKQDFVAMISHDLRTPLGSILGTLTMLEEGIYGALSDKGVKRVSGAHQNARRLIGMVSDLLDIDRMEHGLMQLDVHKVPLGEIFDASINAVRSFAEQHDVILEADSGEIELNADSERIVQVVVNLLSNAVKFSPKGGSVRLSGKAEDGFVEISVVDQGRGIPKELQDSVFQKFKQVSAQDGKRGKGTGLGLPICKAIVESHGGTIGVESEVDHGSRFFVKLPAKS